MDRFRVKTFIFTFVFSVFPMIYARADLATCLYFYRPLPGLKNFTMEAESRPNTLTAQVLGDVIRNHFSVKEITPHMTVEAFSNFVDLIDPNRTLITHEDLQKLGFPNPTLYGDIQNNLIVKGLPSTPHTVLLRIMNERLDSYVAKFVHNESFRLRVLDRANEILDKNLIFSDHRLAEKKEIEDRVIDYLAINLIRVNQDIQRTLIPKIGKSDLSQLIRSLRETVMVARENFANANIEQLVIKSYLHTFDQHTTLLLPNERKNFQKQLGKDKETRLGVVTHMSIEGFKLHEVVKGGAADMAGLAIGDTLLSYVEGFNSGVWHTYKNKSLKDFSASVAGEPGTHLRLRVRRGETEFETLITRQIMNYADFTVKYQGMRETPSGPIVSVKLTGFAKDSSRILKDEISKHLKKGIKGIVLDLRGNTGGLIGEMSEILQLFVSAPHSMYTKTRHDMQSHRPELMNLAIWDGPLIVLVDQKSASASEALAAALKSYKRALVIGGPYTYGKGSQQQLVDRSNVYYKYTDALFFSPNGVSIQWRGVEADIPLPVALPVVVERNGKNPLKPSSLSGGFAQAWPIIKDLNMITRTLKALSSRL